MRKWWWLFLIFIPVQQPLVGQVPVSAVSADTLTTIVPKVIADTAVLQALSMIHRRMSGHSTEPDLEWIWCLQGYISLGKDTIYIRDIGAVLVSEASDSTADVDKGCDLANYLGTVHHHLDPVVKRYYPPPNKYSNGCYFSTPDLSWFRKDKYAIVMMVTCDGGKVTAVVKPFLRPDPDDPVGH